MIVNKDKVMTRKDYRTKRKHDKRRKKTVAIRKGTVSAIIAASMLAPANAAHASGTKQYTVKQGDTLYKLSKQAGSTVDAIKQLNKKTGDTIRIGEVILLPETEKKTTDTQYDTRTIKRGDTWYKFSQETKVSVEDLMKLNKKTSTLLVVGETILLPSPTPVQPVSATEQTQIQKTMKSVDNKTATEVIQAKRIVQKGESLWKIAREYRTTVDAIRTTNHLKNNKIKPGQVLAVDGVTKAAVTINGSADRNFVEFRLGSAEAIVLKVTPFFEYDQFVSGEKAIILYNDKNKELISYELQNS